MKKNILMIVGSMRKESFNRQLANKIKEILGDRAEVSFLEYSDIPYMNQDIESQAPNQIVRVKDEVLKADALWVITPEYNFSYPGVLKNLLDWLSRPLKENDFSSGTAVKMKKVTISGVSGKSAAGGARKKLTELLKLMKMELMETPQTGVALTSEAFKTDKIDLSQTDIDALNQQVDEFLKFIGE
ncbi:NAD(P)H-dependent oxidoreductase [Peptostreptococcaceae bacterium oral taxon 081]|nr:NAD(P)H-dependent oxidoreductase [Peptostreptococcaceae bacterium oral taxon 081]